MTEEEIYNRDVSFVKESDILIADVTVPSLGVGYEIAYAEKLNKKIYCLYYQIEDKKISAMITGNQNCKVFYYKNEDDISDILKKIFNK